MFWYYEALIMAKPEEVFDQLNSLLEKFTYVYGHDEQEEAFGIAEQLWAETEYLTPRQTVNFNKVEFFCAPCGRLVE